MIGYDNIPLNKELLLHLTFEEMTGTITHDRAKPSHPTTLQGVPTWGSLANGLPYLDFNSATPDWLECPIIDTADLDFTSGDFSMVMWVNVDAITDQILFARGLWGAPAAPREGWDWYLLMNGSIQIRTLAVAASRLSLSIEDVITTSKWILVGAGRQGVNAKLFCQGEDVTFYAEDHIDPDTANRKLHIGIHDDEVTRPFDGKIAGGPCGPRIWGRYISSKEHKQIFELERHWLGA